MDVTGVKLRVEQLQLLSGLEPPMCKLILDALVMAQFLSVTSDGSYVPSTEGPVRSRRPLKADLKARPSMPTSRRAS